MSKSFEHTLGCTMAGFVGLILLVVPGMFFVYFLPVWVGLPLALLVAATGIYGMLRLSDEVNGTSFSK